MNLWCLKVFDPEATWSSTGSCSWCNWTSVGWNVAPASSAYFITHFWFHQLASADFSSRRTSASTWKSKLVPLWFLSLLKKTPSAAIKTCFCHAFYNSKVAYQATGWNIWGFVFVRSTEDETFGPRFQENHIFISCSWCAALKSPQGKSGNAERVRTAWTGVGGNSADVSS